MLARLIRPLRLMRHPQANLTWVRMTVRQHPKSVVVVVVRAVVMQATAPLRNRRLESLEADRSSLRR
jgi:hypothetical protein